MELTPYVDSLQRELAVVAAAGGPEAEALAERLTAPLDSAVRLTLQEAVVDAAAEITMALTPGSVDVRLAGRGLAFVVTPAAAPADLVTPPVTSPTGSGDDGTEGGTSRITFRPSDRLKAGIEAAAEREGLSVNAYLVRVLTLAVRREGAPATVPLRPLDQVSTPQGGQRLSGWAR
ncbi:histidine kinase [Knoellia locipacati]|uniref:histidine kinase n=1 Tax=Knoellia locipacati TaxID=882824 RepID=UPI00384B31D1